jgi:hypothetical protein
VTVHLIRRELRDQLSKLVSRWPEGLTGIGEDRITAVLYRPRNDRKIPAAVIVNSSGGVSAQTDHYYARVLVREGMAALLKLPRKASRRLLTVDCSSIGPAEGSAGCLTCFS